MKVVEKVVVEVMAEREEDSDVVVMAVVTEGAEMVPETIRLMLIFQ